MNKNNVYSNAKIISKDEGVQNYQLSTFPKNNSTIANEVSIEQPMVNNQEPEDSTSFILEEIRSLNQNVQFLGNKLQNLENSGMSAKEIDAQVVQAIKDLRHYANFFEQATFQMESKLLKTSMSIARKIIAIELGENSSLIAKQTITNLLEKVKNASRVRIHLNPKDYVILKNDLNLENFIELIEDPNVTMGGVVIASDLGNFDGNIEAKVSSMLESLDSVI